MSSLERYFEDVTPGMELPPLVKRPGPLQLFRFSAVTWNAHRIHYDQSYAREEGYSEILVQSHLHGCFLAEAVKAFAGPAGRLVRFRWQNRRAAYAGEELTCTGVVKRTFTEGGLGFVECDLEERNSNGELCAPGWAVIALPLRSQAPNQEGI